VDDGGVWVISAEREVGKSLRRRRVRERWWGWVRVLVLGEVELRGVRERVQASLGRKRGVEEDVVVVVVLDREEFWFAVWKWAWVLVLVSRMAWLMVMSSSWRASSHWVSQFPARKSGCASTAAKRSRFVLIPEIVVSCTARRALLTTSSHERAVTIIFATTLSKSAPTLAGEPCTSAVSTRTPLPDGKWKDWILPMLSA
jgi:hypothetical protein